MYPKKSPFPILRKAIREHYTGFVKTQKDFKHRKTLPNIAIVNQNFTKYTETFVCEKINNLQEEGFYFVKYYGGLFPKNNAETGHLISSYSFFIKIFELIEILINKPQG